MHGGSADHILIARLSAMGDVAMTVPVVDALRRAYPDVQITILTRESYQPFFKEIAGIEFITPDFEGAHKGLPGLWRLARSIIDAGVTHFADLHDVLRTKVLRNILRLFGLRASTVDKGREGKRLLTRKFRKELKQQEHMISRYSKVLGLLGFKIPAPAPAAKVDKEIPPQIIEIAGDYDGRWIGIAPFAQHKAKIYPIDLTCELIRLLSKHFSRVFIFGGGPYEKQFAELMEERHGNVISVQGRVNLALEMDLIANLNAVITMDSATMHIASIVGTRVVSVWGATHPYAGFYGFGQHLRDAVQLDLPCRPCSVYGNKPCMFKDYRCMEGIEPVDILERTERVVASERFKR